MRYCTCRHHQASRSRAGATAFLLVAMVVAAIFMAGCVSDGQVSSTAGQAQAVVDQGNRQIAAARAVLAPTTQALSEATAQVEALKATLGPDDPQTKAAQAAVDRLRANAAKLSAGIDKVANGVAATSTVLQQLRDHPGEAPDLTGLMAVAAPIPYGPLAVALIGIGTAVFQTARKSRADAALTQATADLADHQTALAEIVPAVQDLKKAVPPESASLWEDQARNEFSDSTKALVAVNKA